MSEENLCPVCRDPLTQHQVFRRKDKKEYFARFVAPKKGDEDSGGKYPDCIVRPPQ